uniref:HABP4_PAI-RBP1 domain-containing protein n=1 Tax=Heterorhabditis bacteriophora TaxID=37862 RepID=A0A1I7XA88_HETBA
MVEYGCNVANKFGFMSDDDEFEDPQELIIRAAQFEAEKAAAQKKAEKLAAKQPVVAPKEIAKPVGKENRPTTGERGRGRGRGRGSGNAGRPSRDSTDVADRFGENRGRGGPRGGRGRGTPLFVKEMKIAFVGFVICHNLGVRGRRGPRGTFTGERRPRGAFRGGRQFDRQSGSDRTGVRGTDKKEGYGKGNWGNDKDELAGETEPVPTTEEQPEPEPVREKTAEELAQEAQEAELAKQKTLKEFMAAQKKEAPKFNVRKAGEGTQENFGKLVPLQKEIISDEKDEEETIVVHREPRKKYLNIDIQFTDASRGGRDRERGDRPMRGRGGPRGGGRGGRGGNRQQGTVPFDASLEAFPALGSK